MLNESLPLPEISSRYGRLRLLGSGATGSVYKAHDTVLGVEVAVKILSARYASPNEVEYFKQEFQTVVDLKHPHLVQVFDFGQTSSGELFYSMEFFSSGTLAELKLPLEQSLLLSTVVQLCRALQYIHSKGITHLDLKPANVLIETPPGKGRFRVKLTDFGLASLPASSSRTFVYGGTPAYAAPEVLAQAPIDSRADLFSMGVVAYELATSRLPFTFDGAATAGGRAPRPSTMNPALSRDIDTLIFKLLELDPANRYTDANAVIEAVNRLFNEDFAPETEKTRTSYILTPALVGRDEEVRTIRCELAALARVPFRADGTAGESGEETRARQRGGEETDQDQQMRYEVPGGAVPKPTAGLILVTGPTGIGKSRLVQDAKIFSQLNRIAFGVGRSVSGSLMPGAPVVEGLRSLMGTLPPDEAPEPGAALSGLIFPEDKGKPPEFSGPASFAESVYQLLKSSSVTKPIVLCIEDLQWADPVTVKTTGHLARGLFLTALGEFSPETPCRIIVTLDDSGSVPKELRTLLKEWAGAPYVKLLPLRSLGVAAVDQVVSSMFGPQVLPEGAAERLHTATAGVPLFLQQLMAQLLREGALRQELGQWKLEISHLEDLPVPKGTRQRARVIMGGLSPEQLAVMRTLSVLTSPVHPEEISILTKIPYPAARKTLREISERALVTQENGAYYISDGPLRKSIYASMGWRKRRQMHLDAAAFLSTKPMSRRAKTHALAHHHLAAKDREQALKWGLAAARDSMRAQANREAASYYKSLLTLGPEPALKIELLTEYGETLARMADLDGAIKAYKEVLDSTAKADASARAKLLRLIGEAYQQKGRFSQAGRFYRRATSLRSAADDEMALSRAKLAVVEYSEGRSSVARRHTREALDFLRSADVTPAVSSHVNRIAGSILAEKDSPHGAIPYLREALRQAITASDLDAQCKTYTSLSWIYHRLVEDDLCRKAVRSGLKIAERLYAPVSRAIQLMNLGGIHYRNGEYATVIQHLLEASSLLGRAGSVRVYTQCLCNLGLVQIEMGQYETAFQYLERALSLQEDRSYRVLALTTRSAKVTGLIHTGCLDEALLLARLCARQAKKAGISHDLHMAGKQMADVYLLRGQTSKAGGLLTNSLQGFTDIGEKDEICECLAKLASLEETAGRRESSAPYASRAKRLARALKSKPLELMAISSTGPRNSREVLRIRKLASQVESPELRWRAYAACAKHYLDRGDLQAAIGEYGKCVAVFRSVAADMKDENLKRSYLSHPERSRILAEIKSLGRQLSSTT